MAEQQGSLIFEHCAFAFIISKDLSLSRAKDLQKTLEEHAGVVEAVQAQSSVLNLDGITHIITSTTDFAGYKDARSFMVRVVAPTWIAQSLSKNKQVPVRPYTPDPNLFFNNVTLTCADIPQGDKDAIIGAVVAMGGMESSSLTKLTTHVCALTLDHPKCQEALQHNKRCKIVLPHWFDDCLKLGKRIDESPYMLPNPEILQNLSKTNIIQPCPTLITGATSPLPEIHIQATSPTSRRLDIFSKKTIMIADDLGLSGRMRGVIEALIESGGGNITSSVESADIYICHFREGVDYIYASQVGLDVGNLSWLYYLITHNEWTSPMRRLLHYPLPRNGIPGFNECRITLSNYGGDARSYLENLVLAAGGKFTKSMKPENTHLITARKSGEKCEAADTWNVNIVNHLWIEESYAKCKLQSLTKTQYTHFPHRTHLGEVIGQTQFDASRLEELYFPRIPGQDASPRAGRSAVQEKAENLSGLASKENLEGESSSVAQDYSDSVKTKVTARPKPKQPHPSQFSTPIHTKKALGKENDTPSSTGSRGAKDMALSRLQNLAPDIALYEKEKKRKGNVWGGDRAANQIEKRIADGRGSSSARSMSPLNQEGHDFSEDGRVPKRQRTSLPPVEIRLLITGYKGWLNDVHKEDLAKKKLRELGILVVQDPASCTHLAAPTLVRTQKFLCALATAPVIVSTDFIDSCIENEEVPSAEEFILKDKHSESKYNLKLKSVVSRAKANKRSLLRHALIYCTAEVPNGVETYKAITEANGSSLTIYRGRAAPTIKETSRPESSDIVDPVYLISGKRPDEKRLWLKFEEMAKAVNLLPRIVSTEWLLDVAMSQQLRWDEKYLINKE